MITKIEAVNFRCLRAVSQALGRFHVVAGPNGSGKSTFFEVPRLLAAFGKGGLDTFLDAAHVREFDELLFMRKGRSFEMAVEVAAPEKFTGGNPAAAEVIRYEVRIGGKDDDDTEAPPRILAENLWLLPKAGESVRADRVQMELEFPSPSLPAFSVIHDKVPKQSKWRSVAKKTGAGNSYFKAETTKWNLQIRNAANESALRSLPSDDRFPVANWFRDQLFEGAFHLALKSDSMRQASPPVKRAGFAPDGSNLPHLVAELPDTTAGKRAWIEHVQTVLPIADVRVVTMQEDNSRYLVVVDHNGAKIPAWSLSDGTLRLLALTLLPYIPQSSSVFFIEEPENGIHPQAVEAVFQSLGSVYDGQVMVATHSPVMVGLCAPEQLLCFSKTGSGETDVLTGDRHPMLRDWRQGLPLARMYAAGILS
jgi:predicted ATPase